MNLTRTQRTIGGALIAASIIFGLWLAIFLIANYIQSGDPNLETAWLRVSVAITSIVFFSAFAGGITANLGLGKLAAGLPAIIARALLLPLIKTAGYLVGYPPDIPEDRFELFGFFAAGAVFFGLLFWLSTIAASIFARRTTAKETPSGIETPPAPPLEF